MSKYTILGFSNAMSMIIEALYKMDKDILSVSIVMNIPIVTKLPYEIPMLEIEELNYFEDQVNLTDSKLVLGVYSPLIKKKVVDFFQKEADVSINQFMNIVHPNSEIASTSILSKGIFINPLTVVSPYANLGNWVTINRKSSIGHHTLINDYCTINPGVDIGGRCNIGEGTTIGLGAKIIDDITVGTNSVVGAGALVTKDIPDNVVAYGTPAKIIRKNM